MTTLLTYAIGDVHGRSDLLKAILDFIERDSSRRGRLPRIIFLGDVVDRGHDSRGCLDIVGRVLVDHPGSVFLRGNHDDWFRQFLEGDYRERYSWYHYGGMETVDSYTNLDIEPARALILRDHPDHLDLIRRSPYMIDDGSVAFVHAGIRPSLPITEQVPKDMMWMREGFLYHVGKLDRIIVHGHSVMDEGRPVVTENRISMDTGSCWNGRLSVMVIDAAERELSFWQTDGDHRAVVEVDPVRRERGMGTVLDDLSWLDRMCDQASLAPSS